METKDPVREALWRLINEHPDRVKNLESLLPRTYLADAQYYDFWEFSSKCRQDETNRGLSSSSYEGLIKVAFFIFRGVHYIAYANEYVKKKGVPAVYVASRARLSALECVLSRSEIEQHKYVKLAYADLLEDLPLPEQGYDFSIFDKSFMAHELSRLRLAFNDSNPAETITAVLQMRNSNQGENVRQLWAERLWKGTNSCAIGQRNQSIRNVTVHGNLYQNYYENACLHASARN